MNPAREKSESPLSLRRITDAFAQMLGRPETAENSKGEPLNAPAGAAGLVCPRSIVESILFVGRAAGGPFSAEELARSMRDVTPVEIESVVGELNRAYEADGAPYRISASAAGFQLELREEFHRLGHKLRGRVREAKLSPQALEVLAVVAYRQPVTTAQIEKMRNGKCGAVLAQLVRRGLLRFDRPPENLQQSCYSTTDRFLRLFGLASLSQLPEAEEFDLSMP